MTKTLEHTKEWIKKHVLRYDTDILFAKVLKESPDITESLTTKLATVLCENIKRCEDANDFWNMIRSLAPMSVYADTQYKCYKESSDPQGQYPFDISNIQMDEDIELDIFCALEKDGCCNGIKLITKLYEQDFVILFIRYYFKKFTEEQLHDEKQKNKFSKITVYSKCEKVIEKEMKKNTEFKKEVERYVDMHKSYNCHDIYGFLMNKLTEYLEKHEIT